MEVFDTLKLSLMPLDAVVDFLATAGCLFFGTDALFALGAAPDFKFLTFFEATAVRCFGFVDATVLMIFPFAF